MRLPNEVKEQLHDSLEMIEIAKCYGGRQSLALLAIHFHSMKKNAIHIAVMYNTSEKFIFRAAKMGLWMCKRSHKTLVKKKKKRIQT